MRRDADRLGNRSVHRVASCGDNRCIVAYFGDDCGRHRLLLGQYVGPLNLCCGDGRQQHIQYVT
ncbi:hypothetical protein B1T51_02015 [Mycobacterium kansasii]|nr:hypothetical protein B1T47_26830 [Mycobacterium kansasii]ARG73506.1 hypothetical protein B1T51_02015 [Mycobacterium kansasii]